VDIDTVLTTLTIAETYCCEHLQRRCVALLRHTQQRLLREQQWQQQPQYSADIVEQIDQALQSHA
jgi:hypothetical protein